MPFTLRAQPENLRFLLVESYSKKTPYLAKWLKDNVLEGLAVFALPDNHRRRLNTPNPAERGIQKELKLRTRRFIIKCHHNFVST
jgi:transposase-like protein